ncbi:uncharacterized protein [Cicer arietinum]|uniref:Uncharacterized protein LOC105852687 n=1 Tax=Cicer arietinum TaxID=3827 RepID=A0A1S3EI36_CICAR|nr:uncharacterized protein LOC105852687 [Cicer arietinum]
MVTTVSFFCLNSIGDLIQIMDRRKKGSEKTTASEASVAEASPAISASEAFTVNLLCGVGLALSLWVANTVYSINLVTDPSLTLFIISITELPIVILLYSRYRQNRQRCSVFYMQQ